MVLSIVVSGSLAYKAKVTTRFGQVQGLLSRSARGRLVAHYLGIPFAQPPVDDLRFRVSLCVNKIRISIEIRSPPVIIFGV